MPHTSLSVTGSTVAVKLTIAAGEAECRSQHMVLSNSRAYVGSLNRNGVSDSIWPTYEAGRYQQTTDGPSVQVPARDNMSASFNGPPNGIAVGAGACTKMLRPKSKLSSWDRAGDQARMWRPRQTNWSGPLLPTQKRSS